MMNRRRFLASALLVSTSLTTLSSTSHAAEFSHAEWDALLKKYVHPVRQGLATQVNYQGLAQERRSLLHYLDAASQLSRSEFDRWSLTQQLAFLINIYNAATVELILSRGGKLTSIKDVGSWLSSPWKIKFISLFGERHTLDDIEHGMIRGSGRYTDPRIHFAVNCASIGCPALRPEAYTAHNLELQLEDATFNFLSDPTRNRLDVDGLHLSSIFKWYQEDFEKAWRGSASLTQFLARYGRAFGLDKRSSLALAQQPIAIHYLDYDWKLNGQGGTP